jgi:hypothetical protein
MTTLSEIVAAIETSAAKVKTLEAELTSERENSRTLVEQYRAQSADALKTLGIEAPRKERKARSQNAVLMSAANRAIRQAVKNGEKNAKAILAAAVDAAEKTGKKKLNLAEMPAEIRQQIEERVKTLGKKQ